jgi:hypothetical protein
LQTLKANVDARVKEVAKNNNVMIQNNAVADNTKAQIMNAVNAAIAKVQTDTGAMLTMLKNKRDGMYGNCSWL